MGVEQTQAPPVVIDDPGTAGLAYISASLFEQTIARAPERARRLRGSAAFWTTDYRSGVTVRFEGSRISIVGRCEDDAWLYVESDAITMARLGGGDHDLHALLKRQVRVKPSGLLRHPLFAIRLRRLMSA